MKFVTSAGFEAAEVEDWLNDVEGDWRED